jgi:hypothetical protein
MLRDRRDYRRELRSADAGARGFSGGGRCGAAPNASAGAGVRALNAACIHRTNTKNRC